MKIAIMATGCVGGYFGARLAAAGEDVHFIARGAHLAALRESGLTLKSANGDLHLQPISVTDDPATIGPVDIVLFAVKQYDTEAAATLIKPLIGPETAVITLQNGMDRDQRLRRVVGREHFMEGAAYIAGAGVTSPSVISHLGKVARVIFGESEGRKAHAATACSQPARTPASMRPSQPTSRRSCGLSSPCLRHSAESPACCASRWALSCAIRIRANSFSDAIAEVVAVAKAKEIDLGADYLSNQIALSSSIPPHTKSSMQMDLEAGRPLELEWMSGAVARIGDELGVPTPIHHFIYTALKLYANEGGKDRFIVA